LAFKTLDVNGDGKIEKSELYNLLERNDDNKFR
jgi:Ca2+-binding EF-hand superfamily protein